MNVIKLSFNWYVREKLAEFLVHKTSRNPMDIESVKRQNYVHLMSEATEVILIDHFIACLV